MRYFDLQHSVQFSTTLEIGRCKKCGVRYISVFKPTPHAMPIAIESPNQPEVIRLIDELDAYQKPLYPAESHHGIDIAALAQANVIFAVVRAEDGSAIACGAVVVMPEYGELKRMFVRPEYRGQAIAKNLLAFLEAEAGRQGCKALMLETGVKQTEALGLYERAGYLRRGPFADYIDDPLSVFMHKTVMHERTA